MFVRNFIVVVLLAASFISHAQNPVVGTRPRVLLSTQIKNALIAKKNANDADWKALRDHADELITWPLITPYNNPDNFIYLNDKINYYYQGSRWLEVTTPIALAYQVTGDAKYSNKLKQLADVIINAGDAPVKPGLGYAARNVGRVVAIIYDWCYDALTPAQRQGLVDIMKQYHKFLRFDDPNGGAYQNYENASGNYYWGHPDAVAFMGYAIAGDDNIAGDPAVTSGEMIAWARQRFEGKVINGLLPAYHASDYVKQTFDGGYPTIAGRGTNREEDKGSPHQGGVHVQGYSYGSDVFSAYIDYVQLVKTATGEDLITPNEDWWIAMFRNLKHSLLPNGWDADEAGDNGTNYGIRVRMSLPLRLAFVLKGTPYGSQVQHFLENELRTGPDWDDEPVNAESWERMYYGVDQAAAPADEPLYYTGFNYGYNLGKGNGAMPYFLMRNEWGTEGTWISFQASPATFDDHDHFNAGHLDINFKGEYLLSSPSESNYGDHSGACNTLFLDDRGDFQTRNYRTVGGQYLFGRNQVIAAVQNDSISYFRSDLTTAYNKSEQNLITTPANRKLDYFIRSFVYLRPSNIVVVYDQTKVKKPAAGVPYDRHIRWHFANNAPKPTATGRKIKAVTSSASLNVHTVLPQNATIEFVDQRNNPDAGTYDDYSFESDTWRAEVAGDPDAEETDYLTVLQPGELSMTEMETISLVSGDGSMDGVLIKSSGGNRNDLVFFNKEDKALQTSLASMVLPVAGEGKLYYTVVSTEPGALYLATVDLTANTVSLEKNATGTIAADVAGVIRFILDGNNPINGNPDPDPGESTSLFVPNLFSPTGDGVNEIFRIRGGRIASISLKVFNSFGLEVFGTTDPEVATITGWDGTYHGTPQPAGVYIWKIQGAYDDGSPVLVNGKNSGQLMLVR